MPKARPVFGAYTFLPKPQRARTLIWSVAAFFVAVFWIIAGIAATRPAEGRVPRSAAGIYSLTWSENVWEAVHRVGVERLLDRAMLDLEPFRYPLPPMYTELGGNYLAGPGGPKSKGRLADGIASYRNGLTLLRGGDAANAESGLRSAVQKIRDLRERQYNYEPRTRRWVVQYDLGMAEFAAGDVDAAVRELMSARELLSGYSNEPDLDGPRALTYYALGTVACSKGDEELCVSQLFNALTMLERACPRSSGRTTGSDVCAVGGQTPSLDALWTRNLSTDKFARHWAHANAAAAFAAAPKLPFSDKDYRQMQAVSAGVPGPLWKLLGDVAKAAAKSGGDRRWLAVVSAYARAPGDALASDEVFAANFSLHLLQMLKDRLARQKDVAPPDAVLLVEVADLAKPRESGAARSSGGEDDARVAYLKAVLGAVRGALAGEPATVVPFDQAAPTAAGLTTVAKQAWTDRYASLAAAAQWVAALEAEARAQRDKQAAPPLPSTLAAAPEFQVFRQAWRDAAARELAKNLLAQAKEATGLRAPDQARGYLRQATEVYPETAKLPEYAALEQRLSLNDRLSAEMAREQSRGILAVVLGSLASLVVLLAALLAHANAEPLFLAVTNLYAYEKRQRDQNPRPLL